MRTSPLALVALPLVVAACGPSSSSPPRSHASPATFAGDAARDRDVDDERASAACVVDDAPLPELLSATGIGDHDVRGYDVLAPLWSDGAEKRRFVRLPCAGAGATEARIDTSDMDAWRFPRGTVLWKEFVVDGRKVETRVMKKLRDGDGEGAWDMSAYAWDGEQREARKVPGGHVDATTGWTAPDQASCMECHGNLPGRVIGFSALQLGTPDAAPGRVTLASLVDEGRLTHTPASTTAAVHAWPDVAMRAQLALHASCAHCHRDGGQGALFTEGVTEDGAPIAGLSFAVSFADADATDTAAMRTAVGVPLVTPLGGVTLRIQAREPGHSGVFHRMTSRGSWMQMPPLGTDVVDTGSVHAVHTWIASMP